MVRDNPDNGKWYVIYMKRLYQYRHSRDLVTDAKQMSQVHTLTAHICI